MFERFTDRARRAVVLAQEESRFFNHSYIGTEHLLLGLLREEEGVAARTLTSVGLDLEGVQAAVNDRVGRGPEAPKGHIPFTPRAKKVLELALREALKLGHNYIGTEHVLLGLLTEGEGVAAQIMLTDVDGGLEHVTDEVMAALVEAGSVSRGQQTQRSMGIRMSKSLGPPALTIRGGDEVVRRLVAIEARLEAIEHMLREQHGGEEVV